MKKNLFGTAILLFGLLITLPGCKDPNKGNGEGEGAITGITVSPTELTFSTDDEGARLTATLSPKGANAEVVWASTDTTIATVNNKGYVTPTGAIGTTKISATCGKYSDTCVVTVKSYLETLSFNGFAYMSLDTLKIDGGRIHEIEASDGTTYKAYLAEANVGVFSEGFYINNTGSLDGEPKGAMVEFTAPMYYVSNYNNGGKGGIVFSLGQWGILSGQEANAPHVGTPGSVDESVLISNVEKAVNALNNKDNTFSTYLQAAGAAVSGATLKVYTYDTDETGKGGYYSQFVSDAIATEALFFANDSYSASNYMMGLDYSVIKIKPILSDFVNYYWGCRLNIEDNQFVFVDKNVHYGDEITYQTGEIPSEKVAGLVQINAPVLSIDYPEVYQNIQKQLHHGNTMLQKK